MQWDSSAAFGPSKAPPTMGALRKSFVPNKVVVFLPDSPSRQEMDAVAPYLKSYSSNHGHATAYVCSNYSCSLATNDPREMMALLKGNG